MKNIPGGNHYLLFFLIEIRISEHNRKSERVTFDDEVRIILVWCSRQDLNLHAFACGGGFPIRIKGGCVIGFIGCSGLADDEDHAAILQGLDKFFKSKGWELKD